MAPPTLVDSSIANHVNEIKAQPYAKPIVSEDGIERNFGYKIIRQQVATGRNSVIFKCESAKRPNIYCLVKSYRLGKEKIKASFKEETCQILRYVAGKCQTLISTYDMYYTNDKIYLMCDWSAKGEVLACMRAKSVRLTEEMLQNWTIDILSAVTFLHNNAICHRNIAPSCLLLTAENRVKIGTLSDAVIYCKFDGTLIKQKWPKFSRNANWNQAPEVAKGKLYDPRRADIWSIGATVYWFIVRNYPIDYRSSSRLTKQLENRLSIMRKVSNRCMEFVKRMLTFQPSQRPTIHKANELEWVAGGVSGRATKADSASGAAAPEIATGGADTGEATGPDESPADAEPTPAVAEQEGQDEVGAE